MKRVNPARMLGLLVAMVALFGGAALLKGGFYFGKHEGDTLHFMQIVLRMEAGQIPHLHFMTPIGALAFAPFSFLIGQGLSAGMAILWAQVLAALLILPAVWWVAVTRMGPWLGALLGLVIMVLMLALVHGEAERAISISMHYNRWAWAAAFLAILTALIVPERPRSALIDGVLIGLMMAVLAMIKATYFAAFAIPVLVALLGTGQRAALGVALLTGLAVFAGLTLWLGFGYWTAYLGDLLIVAMSEVRPAPGEDLQAVIVAPLYKGASLLAVVAVILLRQAGQTVAGLVLLLLLPGFFYVTYQNFGNDPQWLYLLAILLFAFRPGPEAVNGAGWNLRQATHIAGAMAMAFAMPSFFNLAFSPFRHFSKEVEEYAPVIPGDPRLADLQIPEVRAMRVDARVARDGPGSGLEAFVEAADRDEPNTFRGERFAYCKIELGVTAHFQAIADDIAAAGLDTGRTAFAADLFNSYWLFGGLEPLPGGAPWYYGGLPGWAMADYLIVPLCPLSVSGQGHVLEAVTEAGTELVELRRTPLYVLYGKPG